MVLKTRGGSMNIRERLIKARKECLKIYKADTKDERRDIQNEIFKQIIMAEDDFEVLMKDINGLLSSQFEADEE